MRGEPASPVGWVADLGGLGEALRALAQELDHGLLNEKPGLESPTLERLCAWFAERLKVQFPGLVRVVVARPSVGESSTYHLSPPLG